MRELEEKKLLLSYFDLPPISNSYDLLFKAAIAMKSLWPTHYVIELRQIMSGWHNPEENTLLKEKEMAIKNIHKLQAQGDERLIDTLRGKVSSIDEQLERESTKTKLIIMGLSRLQPNNSIDDYMPIIREELSKADQSQGLILLGLYCLESTERQQTFIPLYWTHLCSPNSTPMHLMSSLKAMTDFAIRTDLSALPLVWSAISPTPCSCPV